MRDNMKVGKMKRGMNKEGKELGYKEMKKVY